MALSRSRFSIENLRKKVQKTEERSNNNFGDERFYYPERDENGNASVVIRFLPEPEGEDMPWVKTYQHSYKGPGGFYIEECPTTIGEQCPMCELNSQLVNDYGGWDSTPESEKSLIRKRKRKVQYIANILVVEDKRNPELNGKVMLFRFGPKIFDKIMSALQPEFDDEEPLNPIDPFEGVDFHFRIRKVEGMTNYDKSTFSTKKRPIAETEEEIEAIWKQEYKLSEFISPERFKPFDDLKARLERVLNVGNNNSSTKKDVTNDVQEPPAKQKASKEDVFE
ncbi:MAG: single-stranded DNA-binding protein, partial [Methanobacteriota archaeon]